MNHLYRFSPVENKKSLNEVLEYLTVQLEKLSQEVFKTKLPINTLKIFPHYFDEYNYLYNLISDMGPEASFSSDTSYYVKTNRQIHGHTIEYLGVRVVDPYRLHVGCGDYEIPEFEDIKTKHVGKSQFVRQLSEDMLEVWHPDYDVLGYVVPPINSAD